jgi:hypothetical protein
MSLLHELGFVYIVDSLAVVVALTAVVEVVVYVVVGD